MTPLAMSLAMIGDRLRRSPVRTLCEASDRLVARGCTDLDGDVVCYCCGHTAHTTRNTRRTVRIVRHWAER